MLMAIPYQTRFPSLSPLSKAPSPAQAPNLNRHGFRIREPPFDFESLHLVSLDKRIVAMSNRSKNRRPLQRGRNLSIEAIQAVQALKRAKTNPNLLDLVFGSKISRLVKSDLISVLRDLLRQNEPILALQVFEEARKEYWYKPQVSLYADMIAVLASNELFEKVELLNSYMRMENLEADSAGFHALLGNFVEFGFYQFAMESYWRMKEVGCEPDASTFRILILGFESKGKTDLSAFFGKEAEEYFGNSLEFLKKEEETVLNHH